MISKIKSTLEVLLFISIFIFGNYLDRDIEKENSAVSISQ